MGYYTQHELEVTRHDGDNLSLDDHKELISSLSGYGFNLFEGDQVKWYEHEKHMREYSVKFPKVRFILSGEGEDSGDIWKEHYVRGKMQRCKAHIVFDDYAHFRLT